MAKHVEARGVVGLVLGTFPSIDVSAYVALDLARDRLRDLRRRFDEEQVKLAEAWADRRDAELQHQAESSLAPNSSIRWPGRAHDEAREHLMAGDMFLANGEILTGFADVEPAPWKPPSFAFNLPVPPNLPALPVLPSVPTPFSFSLPPPAGWREATSSPIDDLRSFIPPACAIHGSRTHVVNDVAKRLGIDASEVKLTTTAPGKLHLELPSSVTWDQYSLAHGVLGDVLPAQTSWVVSLAAAPIDSRALARAENRRAIDHLLAADRSPFATARRRAVVGFCEDRNGRPIDTTWQEAESLLKVLDAYEGARGGARAPRPEALVAASKAIPDEATRPWNWALQAYETARGMR